jgi:uncharacterized protein (DUF1800 family)
LKLRTPHELVVAACRATGAVPRLRFYQDWMSALGQIAFSPESPKGWPEDVISWAAPDAIKSRLDWASAFAQMVPIRMPPADLARTVLGTLASDETLTAISQIREPRDGLTMLLMSPEFQRR